MDKEEQVKVFALIPQRPDISQEYFHEHWRHPHGTMATEMAPLRRYVQSHRTGGLPDLDATAYEGIAIVWFDDLDSAVSMGEDPTYKNHVQPDESNFIDMDGLAFVMTDEYVLRAGAPVAMDAPGGAKAMLLLRRAASLSPEEFAQRFADRAEELAEHFPAATRIALGVAMPVNYMEGAEPACDAVLELSFEDEDDFSAAWEDSATALMETLGGDVDLDSSSGDLYSDLRLIWPASARAGAA